MEELWKDIPGYEGRYQVSNLGRVKSLPRVRRQRAKSGTLHDHKVPGRILKPRQKNSGHLQVQLCGVNRAVHRLVLAAFVGPCPEGMEVCHNDSNPTNNRLDNLRYGTRHSNRVDMVLRGNEGRQKLSVGDVQDIRSRLDLGASIADLAREYGVVYTTVWNIKRGITFGCVE